MDAFVVGITGASGSVLAKGLLEHLATLPVALHVVATQMGEQVFAYETGVTLPDFLASLKGEATLVQHKNTDLFAPIASGSFGVKGMVIAPCSMSTAGKLATGCGDNLLTRAADVCLKERARLVLVPRETPMHGVHLRNLATLSDLGAMIVPPVPQFYSRPATIEAVYSGIVGRILTAMGLPNTLYRKWGTDIEA